MSNDLSDPNSFEAFALSLRPYEGPFEHSLLCPFCLEPFIYPVQTPCLHVFDRQCLLTWFQDRPDSCSCPICETPLFTLEPRREIIETPFLLVDDLHECNPLRTFDIPYYVPDVLPPMEPLPPDLLQGIDNLRIDEMAYLDRVLVAYLLVNEANLEVIGSGLQGEELEEYECIVLAMYTYLERRHDERMSMRVLPSAIMYGTDEELANMGQPPLGQRVEPGGTGEFGSGRYGRVLRLALLMTWRLREREGNNGVE